MKVERWMQQSPEPVLKNSGYNPLSLPPPSAAGEDDIRTPPPTHTTTSPFSSTASLVVLPALYEVFCYREDYRSVKCENMNNSQAKFDAILA